MVLMSVLILTACGMDSAKTEEASPKEEKPVAAVGETTEAKTEGEPEMIIKISNGSSESAPTVITAVNVFKPMVEEATNGKVRVDVYAGAQLGDDTKATEACRAGELEMVNTSTAHHL